MFFLMIFRIKSLFFIYLKIDTLSKIPFISYLPLLYILPIWIFHFTKESKPGSTTASHWGALTQSAILLFTPYVTLHIQIFKVGSISPRLYVMQTHCPSFSPINSLRTFTLNALIFGVYIRCRIWVRSTIQLSGSQKLDQRGDQHHSRYAFYISIDLTYCFQNLVYGIWGCGGQPCWIYFILIFSALLCSDNVIS